MAVEWKKVLTPTVDITDGGTGQVTAQAAIDALTQVSVATAEHILTKDTVSGNAIWKAATGGSDAFTVKVDAEATADYIGAAANDGVLRATTGLSYADGGNFITLGLSHLGIEALTDPGADRIFFWDDGETASKWLTPTEGVQISATNLKLDVGGLTAITAIDAASDYIPVYDVTDSTHKKILPTNLGHRYVNRGDVAAYDWSEVGDKAVFNTDGNWHELDLSSIIPIGTVLVHFRLAIRDDVADNEFSLRTDNYVNVMNIDAAKTYAANVSNKQSLLVAPTSNRKIEYRGTNVAFIYIHLTIAGWWV